jgi:dehydrogenase/reductase SDR family member 7B
LATSLAGKLALVTGASSGIGRATSAAFVARGARVVAVARRQPALESLSAELGGLTHLVPLAADVTDPAAMEALVARVIAAAGLPDVIVANAGVGLDARFEATTDELWREVLEVNLLGVVRTVRAFLPQMVERGRGRIVIVSSIVGKRGTPHYAAYAASKFALHGMADALRAELVGSGVTVGLICPGSTETEFRAHQLGHGPSQRPVRPVRRSAEWVAERVVRLARSGRAESVPGLEGRLLVWADAVAPRAVDWVLGRMLARR